MISVEARAPHCCGDGKGRNDNGIIDAYGVCNRSFFLPAELYVPTFSAC